MAPGDVAQMGLTAIRSSDVPADAVQAVVPEALSGGITGVVWRDFKPGGGTPGQVEEEELGLPGITVELRPRAAGASRRRRPGPTARSPSTRSSPARIEPPSARCFRSPTPASPGSARRWSRRRSSRLHVGLDRLLDGGDRRRARGDPARLLEAARMDGASEWQVFSRVTIPLLAPVLTVVFVTIVINVLKVFDIVISIAPGSVQDDANVIALAMWRTSFGGVNDFGLGVGDRGVPLPAGRPDPDPQRPSLSEGGLMSTAADVVDARVGAPRRGLGADVGEGRPLPREDAGVPPPRPYRAALARPDDRLFFTSLLQPSAIGTTGWWEILSSPASRPSTTTGRSSTTTRSRRRSGRPSGSRSAPRSSRSRSRALAAYAFAWLEFPGRDWLFLVVVALLVVPVQMALMPVAKLFGTLGLFGTIPGVVLFHVAYGLPFAIFLLRNFFVGIPREMLEAARMDGGREWRIFFS